MKIKNTFSGMAVLAMLLICFTYIGSAFSQNVDSKPVIDSVAKKIILSRTLYVVLDNKQEEPYFKSLKQNIEKYWKITPYKFITESEFVAMPSAEQMKYTFLYLRSTMTITGADGQVKEKKGFARRVDNSKDMSQNIILPVLFYYPDSEADEAVLVKAMAGFEYRVLKREALGVIKSEVKRGDDSAMVKILVRSFQAYINPNYSHAFKDLPALYDTIKKKTLVIPKSALPKNCDTEGCIKFQYAHKFKVVPDEEWKTYVASDANDQVYLFMEQNEGAAGREKYIIEASTGEMLYVEWKFPYLLKQNFTEISSGR